MYDGEHAAEAGRREGCDPPHTAGVAAGQGAVQHGPPPMGGGAVDRLSSSCHPDGADRRPGLAEPRGEPQDAGPVRPGPHAPAALVGRPRRGAGLRVHHPRQADAGPRAVRRARSSRARRSPTASNWTRQLAGRSTDLDALAVYTNSFQVRLSPHAAGPGQADARRPSAGKALFFDKGDDSAPPATAARTTPTASWRSRSTCTTWAPATTRGRRWGRSTTRRRCSASTASAPYLHDGRAKTLHDVLTTLQRGRQARQDEPPEAGRDRRLGGVPEEPALRNAAGRDAEHGGALPEGDELPAARGSEGKVAPTGRACCRPTRAGLHASA